MTLRNLDLSNSERVATEANALRLCPHCGGSAEAAVFVNETPIFNPKSIYRAQLACTGCGALVGYSDADRRKAFDGALGLWQTRFVPANAPDIDLLTSMAVALSGAFSTMPFEAQQSMLDDMRRVFAAVAGRE